MLPEDVAQAMRDAEQRTQDNKACRLNVCLCYNSKHEILSAVDKLALKYAKGDMKNDNGDLTESDFEKELFGGFNCKPEILIRTSNEIRLSNFLLYQTDESQYQFIASLWPDFSMWDLCKIIMEYQSVVSL